MFLRGVAASLEHEASRMVGFHRVACGVMLARVNVRFLFE